MKVFKKLFVLLLILTLGITAGILFGPTQKIKAEEDNKLNTNLFVPSTYFEYYKLNNPIDVCQDDNYIYVAENNAIVFYEKATSTYSRMVLTDINPDLAGITKIDCYKGNVFFIVASKIYYLTTPNDLGERELVTTDIIVATYFAIYDDYIYANTSSIITASKINDGAPLTFGEPVTYDSEQLHNSGSIAFAYSTNKNLLYYFTLNGCTIRISPTQERKDIFPNTTNYVKYINEKMYFTSENKFYVYDELAESLTVLFDLNSVCSSPNEIKGFNYYNGKILLVHSNENEIYEYDILNGYTGVSITTTKNATNRLTENVLDIIYQDDYIYVLQKESILRFSTTQKSSLNKKFIFAEDFNLKIFNAKYFAISNNFLLLSNGDNLVAFSFKEHQEGLVCTSLTITFPTDWDYNSITGLYAFDGNFYLLRNKTIDSVQHALVIKLDYVQSSNSFNVKPNDYILKTTGNGQDLTINAFGELYLTLKINETSKKVICYDVINKKLIDKEYSFSAQATKVFCDLENVLCLENNAIRNLTTNTTYPIQKHPNLDQEAPVSITLNLTDGKIYILYKGYILTSLDLPLTTSNSFKIPNDHYTKFYENIKTYKLVNGAKLFEVDAKDEYFNYKNITSCLDLEYIFVTALSESSNFCIVNLEYKSYIARLSDLIEVPNSDNPELINSATTFTPSITKGYYVTRAGAYGLPILNYEQYTTNALGVFRLKTIGAYTPVEIVNGLVINNQYFYLVKFADDSLAYIQKDFIAEKINFFLADITSTIVYDINGNQIGTITPKKVKVYGKDNDMFVIDYNGIYGYVTTDSIDQETTNRDSFFLVSISDTLFTAIGSDTPITISAQQVKVYGQEGDNYVIEYQGEYGYIPTSATIHPKNNAIRNSLVVILVATSFFVTGLYLQIKYNRKREL